MSLSRITVDEAVDKADAFIMELCIPETMTPEQAHDFLGDVRERCRMAIEALEEENPELRA